MWYKKLYMHHHANTVIFCASFENFKIHNNLPYILQIKNYEGFYCCYSTTKSFKTDTLCAKHNSSNIFPWLYDNSTWHHKLQYINFFQLHLQKKILQNVSKCNAAFYLNTAISWKASLYEKLNRLYKNATDNRQPEHPNLQNGFI